MAVKGDKYLGGIGAVRPQHQFDADRLDAYLQGRIAGYRGPLAPQQFQGGESNPTYFLQTPTRNYVLRRKPPGALLKSAHQIDREFRVLSALHGADFPVPEPLLLCEDDDVIGTAFYVMSHVPGRVFLDPTMPDLDNKARAAVYDSVNATLAALHNFDVSALGLDDYGRPGNYFSRQISRWSKQYDASRTQPIPAMDRLIEWLPTAVPQDEETRVIHGDYSFHNVLIHPTEPRVAAVIDWELSTTGHPLGDLMYHTMEWYRPGAADARGSLGEAGLPALGIPSLTDYVGAYCARTGRAVPANLDFYKAYNLFRVAAIVQGVVARGHGGNAASADAVAQAGRVPQLAEAAWQFARNIGAA